MESLNSSFVDAVALPEIRNLLDRSGHELWKRRTFEIAESNKYSDFYFWCWLFNSVLFHNRLNLVVNLGYVMTAPGPFVSEISFVRLPDKSKVLHESIIRYQESQDDDWSVLNIE